MDYSVLMSVYHNEKADHLRASMNSMWNQSIPTNDFVLVCDGPLNSELDAVIDRMQTKHPKTLHVVRLEKNLGLGSALSRGVLECKNEIIARMDSDDISRPERCEKELRVLIERPDVSVVGGIIEEFTEFDEETSTPSSVNAQRNVPESADEIRLFAKKRNPFNHPSVMFRKSAVLKAGNYQDVRYLQDYYLWVHMLIAGLKGYNIQEPLVWMRADNALFKRRSGKLYRDIQINLFRYMKEQGFISSSEYVCAWILRTGSSIAPNWVRRYVFMRLLRKT